MHQVAVMAAGEGFRVSEVRCTGGPAGFDTPEVERGHLLVAARRGVFIRREGPTEVLVDGTVAYLSAPGLVEQFAHPIPGGDVCTAIALDPGLLALAGRRRPRGRTRSAAGGRIQRAHDAAPHRDGWSR